MYYIQYYQSPIGKLKIIANEESLVQLLFEHEISHYETILQQNDVLITVKCWLDDYFNHQPQSINQLPLQFKGTPFQEEVWEELLKIPYGKTVTYNDIAKVIARKRGIKKMSAQAVGNAVGKNPIPVIIPCHRVIGSMGKLTGFSGGMDIKIKLLMLEGQHINIEKQKLES